MNIEGHSAVVTGGGSGMGAETARRLAAAGTKVAVLDRDEEAAGPLPPKSAVSDSPATSPMPPVWRMRSPAPERCTVPRASA